MNTPFDEKVRYRLLDLLVVEPELRQREMAKRVGVSLGKVNYCIGKLAEEGLVKIEHFKNSKNRRCYIYKLTPRGLEEKARATVKFLKRKLREYEQVKAEIESLCREIEESGLRGEAEAELGVRMAGLS